ncbi:hypothetical protein FAGKG844_60172 [Frankia sp. AgKG'84/4]
MLGERMPVYASRPRSLREILVSGAASGDGDRYVFSDGRRFGRRDPARQAASLAAALTARYGIRPGDRVAVCAANCPEWLQLFWAVTSMNAVLVAMNGWWSGAEMRGALELTEPTLVLMDEKRHARLEGDPGVRVLVAERDVPGRHRVPADAVLPRRPVEGTCRRFPRRRAEPAGAVPDVPRLRSRRRGVADDGRGHDGRAAGAPSSRRTSATSATTCRSNASSSAPTGPTARASPPRGTSSRTSPTSPPPSSTASCTTTPGN